MSLLSGLNPAPIWAFFEQICSIPRLSKNEDKIRRFLIDFAIRNGLESVEDATGNILITRPASSGYENIRTIVLQSHMDMVGEKNENFRHDWYSDPIVPVVENGWVRANGTTLGADDGIGVAIQMAILTDKNLKAGKIECLFTVDEESGMTGAVNLKSDFIEGRILVNLDSEDEGILFIGCAGGMDTICNLKIDTFPVPADHAGLGISVTGLRGGHSGDEIHKGFANSIKLMNRILIDLSQNFKILLNSFNGGNLRNAIPRESFATIAYKSSERDNIVKRINVLRDIFIREFAGIENEIEITLSDERSPDSVMGMGSMNLLLEALDKCPHGVIAWSREMTDLVETSTNLATIRFSDNGRIKIVTTQRSSIDSAKLDAGTRVRKCFEPTGAEVIHSEGYPGWKPDLNSEILKITTLSYQKLFGKMPEIRAIHAGLECGLFYEKFRNIDMISFGPTIRGAHTPGEMIEIKTVQMFWDLLLEVIRNIPPSER